MNALAGKDDGNFRCDEVANSNAIMKERSDSELFSVLYPFVLYIFCKLSARSHRKLAFVLVFTWNKCWERGVFILVRIPTIGNVHTLLLDERPKQ